jgi:hypothetical protein
VQLPLIPYTVACFLHTRPWDWPSIGPCSTRGCPWGGECATRSYGLRPLRCPSAAAFATGLRSGQPEPGQELDPARARCPFDRRRDAPEGRPADRGRVSEVWRVLVI